MWNLTFFISQSLCISQGFCIRALPPSIYVKINPTLNFISDCLYWVWDTCSCIIHIRYGIQFWDFICFTGKSNLQFFTSEYFFLILLHGLWLNYAINWQIARHPHNVLTKAGHNWFTCKKNENMDWIVPLYDVTETSGY